MTAPLTPEQVADVLDDAADYIETYGWCQGKWLDVDGRACVSGALNKALGPGKPNTRWTTVRIELGRFLIESGRIPGLRVSADDDTCLGAPIFYNDTEGRTKQEVLDAFRAAAKQQRGRSPA